MSELLFSTELIDTNIV